MHATVSTAALGGRSSQNLDFGARLRTRDTKYDYFLLSWKSDLRAKSRFRTRRLCATYRVRHVTNFVLGSTVPGPDASYWVLHLGAKYDERSATHWVLSTSSAVRPRPSIGVSWQSAMPLFTSRRTMR